MKDPRRGKKNISLIKYAIIFLSLPTFAWCIFHSLLTRRQDTLIEWINDSTPKTIDLASSLQASKKKEKHWCVISWRHSVRTVRRHFEHFPHSLEILLPCWSYFREREATENCGIILFGFKELGSWQSEFVRDGMGCDVFISKNEEYDTKTGELIVNNTVIPDGTYYLPNLYLQRPRFGHIQYLDDRRDAHALRKKFVSDEYIESLKGEGKPLQIGMIQRPKSRRIANLEQIKAALQKDIPGANISITDFNYPTVKEQAEWFATKDVIIAAQYWCCTG